MIDRDDITIGMLMLLVLMLALIIKTMHGFDLRIRALEANQSSQEAR